MGKRRQPADRNYSVFYALLRQMERADKGQLVHEFTSGRTDSLKEMTDAEYSRMIGAMRNLITDRAHLRDARSKALRQLQIYGVDTTDWGAVNRFVSQPRIAGKVFARLSIAELTDLVRKMRAIISKGETAQRAHALAEANREVIQMQSHSGLPN